MNDTSFDTIDICSLDAVTGGARKKTTAKKPARPLEVEAPEAYGLGRSFCQREPFACANRGGNI